MSNDHSHHLPSRRAFLGTTAAAGACVPFSGLGWAALPEVSRDMAGTARAWLALLDAGQRARGQLAWTSPLRENWHYVPRNRPGLVLRDMDAAQAAAAWDLLGCLLSVRGLEQMRGQLMVEQVWGTSLAIPVFVTPATMR